MCRYANETWAIVDDSGKEVVKRFKITQVLLLLLLLLLHYRRSAEPQLRR